MTDITSSHKPAYRIRQRNWLHGVIETLVARSEARRTARAIAHLDAHLLADIGLLDAATLVHRYREGPGLQQRSYRSGEPE